MVRAEATLPSTSSCGRCTHRVQTVHRQDGEKDRTPETTSRGLRICRPRLPPLRPSYCRKRNSHDHPGSKEVTKGGCAEEGDSNTATDDREDGNENLVVSGAEARLIGRKVPHGPRWPCPWQARKVEQDGERRVQIVRTVSQQAAIRRAIQATQFKQQSKVWWPRHLRGTPCKSNNGTACAVQGEVVHTLQSSHRPRDHIVQMLKRDGLRGVCVDWWCRMLIAGLRKRGVNRQVRQPSRQRRMQICY